MKIARAMFRQEAVRYQQTSGLFKKLCSEPVEEACPELCGLLTMNLSKDGSTGSP